MIEYTILECFAQYSSVEDIFAQEDGWIMPTYTASNVALSRGSGLSGENELTLKTSLAGGSIYKRLPEESSRVFAGMLVRRQYNAWHRIGFHDEAGLQRHISDPQSYAAPTISIEVATYGQVLVYHTVHTAESGLASNNKQLLAEFSAIPSTCWLYADIDFTGPPEEAKVTIYVDGVSKGTVTFRACGDSS